MFGQMKFNNEANQIVGEYKAKKGESSARLFRTADNTTNFDQEYPEILQAHRDYLTSATETAKSQIEQSAQRHLNPQQFAAGDWKRKQIF